MPARPQPVRDCNSACSRAPGPRPAAPPAPGRTHRAPRNVGSGSIALARRRHCLSQRKQGAGPAPDCEAAGRGLPRGWDGACPGMAKARGGARPGVGRGLPGNGEVAGRGRAGLGAGLDKGAGRGGVGRGTARPRGPEPDARGGGRDGSGDLERTLRVRRRLGKRCARLRAGSGAGDLQHPRSDPQRWSWRDSAGQCRTRTPRARHPGPGPGVAALRETSSLPPAWILGSASPSGHWYDPCPCPMHGPECRGRCGPGGSRPRAQSGPNWGCSLATGAGSCTPAATPSQETTRWRSCCLPPQESWPLSVGKGHHAP